MPILAMTDIVIRTLPQGMHFDARLKAFGIRVGKNRKTWIVVKGANRTKITLGHYPALSLADARKSALSSLSAPDNKFVTNPKFKDAVASFLEEREPHLRKRSHDELKRNLNLHFEWAKQVSKISHHDVLEALGAITHKSEAAHALKCVKTFFNWCIPRYLSVSPCIGIKMQSYKPRERTLSDKELVKVWKRAKEIGYPYGTIVRLLILTGQRIGEISGVEWTWMENNSLTIPSYVAKNGRETTIPLGKMAQAVFAEIPNHSHYLFPARGKDQPFAGFGKKKMELDTCGVEGFTHQDLRRTFATNMARMGVRLEVTERLINHVSGSQGGIVGVYQRYEFLEEKKEAIDKWESFLRPLVEPPKTT